MYKIGQKVRDLDDTLLTTTKANQYATQNFLDNFIKESGYQTSEEDILQGVEAVKQSTGRKFISPPVVDGLCDRLGISINESRKEVLVANYDEDLHSKWRVYSDVMPLLEHIEKINQDESIQQKIGVAILSNAALKEEKRRQYQKIVRIGLDKKIYVLEVMDTDDTKKPQPHGYMKVLSGLGLKKEDAPNILFVGDNPNTDISGANRLQFTTCRIRRSGGSHSEDNPHTEDGAAKHEVKSLKEIQQIFSLKTKG